MEARDAAKAPSEPGTSSSTKRDSVLVRMSQPRLKNSAPRRLPEQSHAPVPSERQSSFAISSLLPVHRPGGHLPSTSVLICCPPCPQTLLVFLSRPWLSSSGSSLASTSVHPRTSAPSSPPPRPLPHSASYPRRSAAPGRFLELSLPPPMLPP